MKNKAVYLTIINSKVASTINQNDPLFSNFTRYFQFGSCVPYLTRL